MQHHGVGGIRHRLQLDGIFGQTVAYAAQVPLHACGPLGQDRRVEPAHHADGPAGGNSASTPCCARRITASASHQNGVASSTNASCAPGSAS